MGKKKTDEEERSKDRKELFAYRAMVKMVCVVLSLMFSVIHTQQVATGLGEKKDLLNGGQLCMGDEQIDWPKHECAFRKRARTNLFCRK